MSCLSNLLRLSLSSTAYTITKQSGFWSSTTSLTVRSSTAASKQTKKLIHQINDIFQGGGGGFSGTPPLDWEIFQYQEGGKIIEKIIFLYFYRRGSSGQTTVQYAWVYQIQYNILEYSDYISFSVQTTIQYPWVYRLQFNILDCTDCSTIPLSLQTTV